MIEQKRFDLLRNARNGKKVSNRTVVIDSESESSASMAQDSFTQATITVADLLYPVFCRGVSVVFILAVL